MTGQRTTRSNREVDEPKGIPNWKVRVVLGDATSTAAFSIFNPNDWLGDSKPVILSCAAHHGLLHYATVKVRALFQQADQLCQPRFLQLKAQWDKGDRWPLEKCRYFVESPELHLCIQGFLGAVKGLLDLVVQLASTECIVTPEVDGFHRRGSSIGGKFLNVLTNNATASKRRAASRLNELLQQEKTAWIDEAVRARHNLVHPRKGMCQTMFGLELGLDQGELRLVRVVKPSVGAQAFDEYAQETLGHVERFCRAFLQLITTR